MKDRAKDKEKKFDFVFTTGGIGPTHDDITAESISKAFNIEYGFHKDAYSILEKYISEKKVINSKKSEIVEVLGM